MSRNVRGLLILGLALIAGVWRMDVPRPQALTPAPPLPAAVDHPAYSDLRITADVVGRDKVSITWKIPEGLTISSSTLYRSTTDLAHGKLDVVHYPIVMLPVDVSRGGTLDDTLPDNVTCYYQLKIRTDRGLYSNIVSVAMPDRPLPDMAQPSLWVDKSHYFLEVRDGGQEIKRYPIALGRNPFDRKLHQDNSTTPEGFYRVCGVQPDADFYRAYDVSYPNDVDKLRYDFAGRHGQLPDNGSGRPDIGGEIQIHGRGIARNWTFGCMALRDTDMDELFSHDEIAVGTPITIVGHEIGYPDVAAIQTPPSDTQWQAISQRLPSLSRRSPEPAILARYQWEHHLPVTGQLDTRTLQALTQ